MLCRNWLQPVLREAVRGGGGRREGLGGGEAATVAAGLDIPAARLLPRLPEAQCILPSRVGNGIVCIRG